MLIRIGFDLRFDIPAPVAMNLMLYTHPSHGGSLVDQEFIHTSPELPIATFTDVFGNRVGRIVAPAGELRIWNETAVRDSGLPDPVQPQAIQWPVDQLPPETLQFLMASRYCDTDRFGTIAWELFGNTPLGWPRVQAVANWVHYNVQFGYQYARSTKTAYDVYLERRGVCRDFSHLLITFLRCLNIPARYATGYLGDIGVPIDPNPMDFSAWTEVFLDGRWFTFDARHNKSRIGRVVMARGRDAVDVALTTSFGPTVLKSFTVLTKEIPVSEQHVSIQLHATNPLSMQLR